MNYYRRYIGEHRRDTGPLTLAEQGAYAVIMDEYYAQDGVIPRSNSELCILCHATSKIERNAVMRVAQRYFPADDSGIRHNAYADKQLVIALQAIEKMRKAGKKGATERWGDG